MPEEGATRENTRNHRRISYGADAIHCPETQRIVRRSEEVCHALWCKESPDYKSDPKFFYRKPRPICRTKREAMEAHQRRLEREKRNRLIAVYYPDYPNSLIAERLGMNVGTLRYLAHHLGLKKKPEVRSDINSNNAFRSWKTRRNNNLNNR